MSITHTHTLNGVNWVEERRKKGDAMGVFFQLLDVVGLGQNGVHVGGTWTWCKVNVYSVQASVL